MLLLSKLEGGIYKMRELFVTTRRETGADGQAVAFDYYILIDEMTVGSGLACESYGVRIAGREGSSDCVSIPNLTVSISRIDALMEQLTRCFVTPSTAADVIADWL